ncbi:MAG: ATPase with chaperone activity [Betaproteobacteria bacterium]|nr:ATPase with chaperone activity [Betaproteobacteria bacterium]
MSESQSMPVPGSFLALYEHARHGPRVPMREIIERHEFCEDLAGMMREPARALLHEMGITESDVLERCHRGLLDPGSGLSRAEADWVVRRLAELLA